MTNIERLYITGKRSALSILWIVFLLLYNTLCSGQEAEEYPRVLVLNSYHPQYAWTEQLMEGLRASLKGTVSEEDLHIEYLDGRRFADDTTYEAMIYDLFKYKCKALQPSLVITSDDYALDFALKHRDSLFEDVPIVFCGINVSDTKKLNQIPNLTGILEGMEVMGNLRLIRHLQPEVMKIHLLGDQTTFGQKMMNRAKIVKTELIKEAEFGEIQINLLDDLSISELYQMAKNAQPDEAFLMLAIHQDRLGNYFSYAREFKKLCQVSKVPVYGMWGGVLIQNDAIGGNMNDPKRHGKETADLVIRILKGENPQNIPIREKATYTPYFNYHQLIAYKIDKNRLPSETVIIGKPLSFYAEHKTKVNATIILLLVLSSAIIILSINIRQRKTAEKALAKMNKELEERVEARSNQLVESEKLATLGQLVASIAHELNTPLGAIYSSGQTSQDSLMKLIDVPVELISEISQPDMVLILHVLRKSLTHTTQTQLSTSETRKARKKLEQQLSTKLSKSHKELARTFQRMGIYEVDNTILDNLKEEDNNWLKLANELNNILRSNQIILTASEKASHVVHALKTYAHHSKENIKESANIITGLEIALTLFSNKTKDNINIQKDFAQIDEIFCYPDELNQVWMNLIQNALQAMNYQGKLSLKVAQINKEIVVSVSDTGKGISEEIKKQIFDPFFTTKSAGEGSGLGLNIVQKIINKHQGRIEVKSQLGKGTTFHVYLPLNHSKND